MGRRSNLLLHPGGRMTVTLLHNKSYCNDSEMNCGPIMIISGPVSMYTYIQNRKWKHLENMRYIDTLWGSIRKEYMLCPKQMGFKWMTTKRDTASTLLTESSWAYFRWSELCSSSILSRGGARVNANVPMRCSAVSTGHSLPGLRV